MDVGKTLKQARDAHGVSLAELARRTNISLSILAALERNDSAEVASGIFTRGYFRAYAYEVGIDAEPLITSYEAQHGGAVEDVRNDDWTQLAVRYAGRSDRKTSYLHKALFVLAVICLIRASMVPSSREVSGVGRRTPETAVTANQRTLVYVRPGSQLETRSMRDSAEASGLRMNIHPVALCWVSATVDGRQVLHRLLKPKEEVTVHADEAIVVRVGDAGAFGYSINDEPGKSIGSSGEAVTIEINHANYRKFVDVS